MKYLNELDIKIIFVLNEINKKKGEKHPAIYGSLKKFFEENGFNRLNEQEIVEVNLVELENRSIFGISTLFKKIKEYFIAENPCLTDKSIDKINTLINKFETIKNNGNKIEKDFKKEAQDCLKELNNSIIFKNFENCKDIIKKGYFESSLYSSGFSAAAFGSLFLLLIFQLFNQFKPIQ